MIKILISVYIASILLFAGFAEASIEATPIKFDRVQHSNTIGLNVADARFDSRREILTLSGNVSSQCLKTINSELQLDERTNAVLVSVTAQGEDCLSDLNNKYEIVIDLKAFFAENALAQDTLVHFQIDNYTAGDNFSFNYLAKKQVKYAFNTNIEGQVELDLRTGSFFLVTKDSKIQILSRFNLNNYVNETVQLKGLTPSQVNIGEDVATVSSKFFIGKLTAVR
jgi:hypothetical protein